MIDKILIGLVDKAAASVDDFVTRLHSGKATGVVHHSKPKPKPNNNRRSVVVHHHQHTHVHQHVHYHLPNNNRRQLP